MNIILQIKINEVDDFQIEKHQMRLTIRIMRVN
jgi:hypothetical protein